MAPEVKAITPLFENDTLTEEQFQEFVMGGGDIARLSQKQKVSYLWWRAKSCGLDPLASPFNIIASGDGKLVVYANRNASDQVRRRDGISDELVYAGPFRVGETIDDTLYQVILKLTDASGRTSVSTGCIEIGGYQGEAKANQVMKCWTKALRRGTLAMGGISMPDETELGFTGAEVVAPPPPQQLPQGTPAPKILDAKPSPQPTVTRIPSARPLPAAVPPAKV